MFPTNPSANQPFYNNGKQWIYTTAGIWERTRPNFLNTRVFERVTSAGRLMEYDINIPQGLWFEDGGLIVHTITWENSIDLGAGDYAYFDIEMYDKAGNLVVNDRLTFLEADEVFNPSNPAKGFQQPLSPANAWVYRVNIRLIYRFNQTQSGDWVSMFVESNLYTNIQ